MDRVGPARKHHRLAEFLYQEPGAYFTTFVTNARKCSLGSIRSAEFSPTLLGEFCEKHIQLLPHRHAYIALDEYVVMPNHIHLVLFYEDSKGVPVPPLTQVIGWLKAGISRDYRRVIGAVNEPLWQRDFHDHIIRTEEALNRIRDNIRNNVLQWSLDHENPDWLGFDPFQQWWEQEVSSQAALVSRYVPSQREP